MRAAASITQDNEIVVLGSQAILGQFLHAPEALLRSVEAHAFPKNKPQLPDLIYGSTGEFSPFQGTFGYYAHGVGKETAILSRGW